MLSRETEASWSHMALAKVVTDIETWSLHQEPDVQVSRQPDQFHLSIGLGLMTLIRTGSNRLGATRSSWDLNVLKNCLEIL